MSSSIGKLTDLIFLRRNTHQLKTSEMQYAFKPKMSTTMCTLVLKEVVTHYWSNQTPVYACFLDATKAFDRVRFDQLFDILIDRQVNPFDLRLLMHSYEHQEVRASWKGQHTQYFPTSNGVKQGSIAAPTLFCLYLESLLDSVKDEGIGCWIGNHFYGCLAYADDITLLSPTLTGLQKMIRVCERVSGELDIQFNSKKTVCVAFNAGRRIPTSSLSLANSALEWSQVVRHLGNFLESNLSEATEIQKKRGALFGQANAILGTFAGIERTTTSRIFHSQCAHYYGSQAWNLCDRHVQSFYSACNSCARRLFDLPHMTHTRYLPLFTGRPLARDSINCTARKFHRSLLDSFNSNVRFLAHRALTDHRSFIHISRLSALNHVNVVISDEDRAIVSAFIELRENPIEGFTDDVVGHLIV